MRSLIFFLIISLIFISGCSNKYIVTPPGYNNKIYGEIYNKTSGGWTFSISDSGYYYNMTGLVPGNIRGFDFTPGTQAQGGSNLKALVGGLYKCSLHLSGEGSQAGGEYGLAIGHNFERHYNCYANYEGSSLETVESVSCLLNLEAGDYVNILIEDESSPSKDISVHTAGLNCFKIV